MTKKSNEKSQIFVNYFRIQELPERKRIKDTFMQRAGVGYPAFYSKIRRRSFTLLELEELEKITGQSFSAAAV